MILDTNALSAMADGDKAAERLLQQAEEISMPTIVLGEYRLGIRGSRNRKLYERWLAELIAACRVLVVDENTAERYAEVRDELNDHRLKAGGLGLRLKAGGLGLRLKAA